MVYMLQRANCQEKSVITSAMSWITDYMTACNMWDEAAPPDLVVQYISSTGDAPQEMVLSPFLFTLYTPDFQYNSRSYHLQVYCDNSAAVEVMGSRRSAEY